MNQDKAAEKAAEVALQNKMVAQIYYWQLVELFKQVYAIGVDEGRLQYTKRKRVIQFTLWGERVEVHDSASIAGRKIGLSKHSISKAATGKTKSAGGFYWRYEEQDDEL